MGINGKAMRHEIIHGHEQIVCDTCGGLPIVSARVGWGSIENFCMQHIPVETLGEWRIRKNRPDAGYFEFVLDKQHEKETH